MDLLAGYGSDVSGDETPSPPRPAAASPPRREPAAAAGHQPPATSHYGLSSSTHGLPADFFDASVGASISRQSAPAHGLNAAPAELAEAAGPEVGPERPMPSTLRADAQDLPQPSDTKLWTKLPAPKPSKKRVVFRPAIDPSALASSDSEDEAAPAKRAKPSGHAASSILSFLPAPKHSTLGNSSAPRSGSNSSSLEQAQKHRAAAAAASAAAAAAPGPAPLGNEAYRVAPAPAAAAVADYGGPSYAVPTPPSSSRAGHAAAGAGDADWSKDGAAAGSHPAVQYYPPQQYEDYPQQQQQQYDNYQQQQYAHEASMQAAAAAAMAPQEPDIIQAALQEEMAKAARRGGGVGAAAAPVVKQVNADKLKYVDPSVKEAQAGMQSVLGTDYAMQLRSEAAPFAGSKMAKRKHQIGTLFHTARLNELKILEQKAAGMKSKAETAGKYGW